MQTALYVKGIAQEGKYVSRKKFSTYMRNQIKEIVAYREKLANKYQRDISRNEAASRWIRECAEDFNAEYMKKLPKTKEFSFRRR